MTRKNDGKPSHVLAPTRPPGTTGNRPSRSAPDAVRRLPHRPDRVDSPVLAADIAAHMKAAVLLMCVISLCSLQGCAHVAMRNASPSPEAAADSPGGIRVMGADHRFADVSIRTVARRAQDLRGGEPVTMLALSGGGADGAFGAGALVGLTHAGARPKFSVITGVSAGAFLAAYAFVGPEWDQQLIDSYTSGRAEHLLQPRGLGLIFDSSVYRGRPLEQLVDHYLSDQLLQAVAREAASGRLLLVATTN